MFLIPKNLSKKEIARRAYIAALLDGEGYIGAIRRMPTAANKLHAPKYSIRITVSMVDEGPIRFLAEFCGVPGLVFVRTKKNIRHRSTFDFDIENERAAELLRTVMPFLICKKQQARMAIELFELRKSSKLHKTKVTKTLKLKSGYGIGHSYRVYALSDKFVARCDKMYLAMRRRPTTNNGINSDAYFGN
jgi:hypothetical protein